MDENKIIAISVIGIVVITAFVSVVVLLPAEMTGAGVSRVKTQHEYGLQTLKRNQNKDVPMNMTFNLEYLAIQNKMQQESRQFSLLSNIMKVKHDTAKNAVSNVR